MYPYIISRSSRCWDRCKLEIGLYQNTPKFNNKDVVKCNDSYIQRDLDVPSSSVPKKYGGTSNMAEFQSSPPTPLQAVLEPRIYISNSYCNNVVLVHVLVVRHNNNINMIQVYFDYHDYLKYIITWFFKLPFVHSDYIMFSYGSLNDSKQYHSTQVLSDRHDQI